jgi:hypothetical protein
MPGSAQGVREYRISSDGSYIVFTSDAGTTGKFELYSVPLGGTTYPAPTKISGTLISTSAGIYNCTSCGNGHKWTFEISPSTNNPFVIYSSEQNTVGQHDLYIASLSGGPVASSSSTINGTGMGSVPTGTKITGAEIGSTAYIDSIGFTFDGSHVMYHASTNLPAQAIYSIDLSYNSVASTITTSAPNTIAANSAVGPFFSFSKSHTLAVYFVEPSSLVEAHIVDLANPGSTNFGLVTFSAAEPNVTNAKFALNDAAVVFGSLTGSLVPIHVFSTNTNPTGNFTGVTVTDYSSLLDGTTKKLYPSKPSGGDFFVLDNGGNNLLFASDSGATGIVKLYWASINTSGTNTSTDVSGTGVVAAGNSVSSYTFSGDGTIYFSAGINVASHPELYSSSMVASPTINRLNSSTYAGDITEIGGNPPGSTSKLFFKAHSLANPSISEGWFYDPSGSTPFVELTPLTDGSTSGLGRVRVSVMNYGPGGASPTPAFSSTCVGYPSGSSDGSPIYDPATPNGIRVPVGPAGTGTSPFAVAVDVYPLATSCSGSFVRYLFPSGILNGTPGKQSNLQGNGSQLTLFLSDR